MQKNKSLQELLEYAQILEYIDDVFAISDETCKIIFLNDKGREISNTLTPDDFPHCYDVFSCTHLEKIPKFCPAKELPAERDKEIYQMSVRIGEKYFKLNCTPVYDHNNKLKNIIHIAKDETENVVKEKKLIRLNKLLIAINNFNHTFTFETLPEKILELACEQLSQIPNYTTVGFLIPETSFLSPKIIYKTNLPIELEARKIDEFKAELLLKYGSDVKIITFENTNANEKNIIKFEETINNIKLCSVALPIKNKKEFLGYFLLIYHTQEIYCEEEISLLQEFIENILLTFTLREKILEKDQIEKKTRELERFYYTLVSNLPGFVYRCRNDRYWTMEYLSENFYKITGYKPEEVVGNKVLSFNDLIHKDHQERIWVKYQIVLNKKEVFQDEYPIITKNGEIRWVFEQGRSIYDEKGKVIAIEGYITDITSRKEIEEKLKESEKKYRALFENSADAIFIMSGDVFLDCNLSALKMFKCERSDIIGKPPYEFSPKFQPDGIPSRKKALDYITRAYRGEELRFEWMHKKLDGTEFECEVSLNKIIYGKKSLLVAIVRDISESKRALYEITKLAKALDSIGEAVSINDLSNKFIYVNKAFVQLYGYTLEEIKGQTPSILRTEESLDPNVDKEIFDKLSKNQTWRGELWNKDKYGRKFKIQLTTNSIIEEKGNVIGYIGVAIDLTERIEIEKAIKESEEKFRTLISSMDDMVFTLDTEHRHNGLYGKWLGNFGLREEDFLGKTATEILGEEDGKIHIEMQNRCLQGETITYEWSKTVGENTYYFQTKISPIYNDKDEIVGIVGIGRDITKLKELEKSIRVFEKIIEQTPTGVFILDTDGKINYINNSLEQILEIQKANFIGKSIQSIHSDIVNDKYFANLFQKVNTCGPQVIELYLKYLNKWIKVKIFPLYDEAGQIINYVGLITDITQEKEYLQQLQESKEKAEELNSLKNYLLLNFSHEFRTPLTGILGWAQWLKSEQKEQEIQEIADQIYKSGKRLLNTVDLIIDYSKLETGLFKVQLREFDIVDTIREIVQTTKEFFSHKNIEVVLNLETDYLVVKLDEFLVRTIVHALVHNAFKFTREGSINTQLRVLREDGSDEYVELIVSDTGIGIPEDKLDLIWKEFYQVNQGLSREFEGQGLGLTLAKKFTEIMGGSISVQSELGKGSTFIVRLPIKTHIDVE